MATERGQVTLLLGRLGDRDGNAEDELIPLVYNDLRGLARRAMSRETPNQTLQPTALVHEAFLRLMRQRVAWQNRGHFFAVAAQMMRRVLIDRAREKKAIKRGCGAAPTAVEEHMAVSEDRLDRVLIVDEALQRLARLDPRQARIVEMKIFGGLDGSEISEAIGVSEVTVKREWASAKAWLRRELSRMQEPRAPAAG